MKKISLLLMLSISLLTFSQNKMEAEKLVEEGIPYHDKGDYEGAINKYNKALELDNNNLRALAEKGYSLLSLKKYNEAIEDCKKAIETHPKEAMLQSVYVIYGNTLDELKKTDEALEIYDEGIRLFPDYYQLYFNKGVSYSSIKKNDEAIKCFQKAVIINPKHAGSYNGLARLEKNKGNKIAAILSFCRFLIIEPQTSRAKENLVSLKELMMQGVSKTGEKSISININPKDLDDDSKKTKENNFNSTNLVLSMASALDFDEKNKNKTEVENFNRKMEVICSSLSETKKDNSGFYWDYLAPYFVDLNHKKLLEPFGYIVFASSTEEYIKSWINNDKTEVDKFYDWSKEYKWKNVK